MKTQQALHGGFAARPSDLDPYVQPGLRHLGSESWQDTYRILDDARDAWRGEEIGSRVLLRMTLCITHKTGSPEDDHMNCCCHWKLRFLATTSTREMEFTQSLFLHHPLWNPSIARVNLIHRARGSYLCPCYQAPERSILDVYLRKVDSIMLEIHQA